MPSTPQSTSLATAAMRLLIASVTVCAALDPAAALAGDSSLDSALHRAMSHRHGLELGLGLLAGVSTATSTEASGVSVESDASGLMGSLTYLYRLNDRFLLTVSGGALSLDATVLATTGGASLESSAMVMLLFGGRYLFRPLGGRESLLPYASIGIGPYVGSASEVRAGSSTSVGSRTDTVPGARVGLGLVAGLNSWLTVGIEADYNLVADFDERIGAETNYSNPDFLLSFAWRFGASD
jgi:hypothetical protein